MSTTTVPANNVADIVRAQAKNRGNALVYEFEGRLTTFAEFDVNTNRVANALIAMGLKKGDRIAYLGKNSDFYFELLMGAMKAGVVMAPVNWRLAGPEVAFIVDDCKAPVLFVGPEFITQVKNIKAAIAGRAPCHHDRRRRPGVAGFCRLARRAERRRSRGDDRTKGRRDPALHLGHDRQAKGRDAVACQFPQPRAAGNDAEKPEWNRWSRRRRVAGGDADLSYRRLRLGRDRPVHGAKGVIAREFDPTKVLDFFEQSGITKLFMVPAAMQFVVRQPRARTMDFSRLKYMLYGASPIPAALLKECIEVFNCGFVQLYGMTETTGTIVALPPEDHVEGLDRMRSAGKALAGRRARDPRCRRQAAAAG